MDGGAWLLEDPHNMETCMEEAKSIGELLKIYRHLICGNQS
jgi:hypothetical protein